MKLAVLFCFAALLGSSGSTFTAIDFPVPPHSKKSLFYIHRSPNPNTVVYEANLTSNNTIDQNDPVKIFWIRYGEKGQLRELNYLEKTFAYGLKADPDQKMNMQFVAKKERSFVVAQDEKGQAYAMMNIGGRSSRLSKIFVQVAEDGWWPKVAYVEFFGTDMTTNTKTYEKLMIKE